MALLIYKQNLRNSVLQCKEALGSLWLRWSDSQPKGLGIEPGHLGSGSGSPKGGAVPARE